MTLLKFISIFFFTLFIVYPSWAQNSVIEGKIVEKNKKAPLFGVHVRITSQTDSTDRYITSTDSGGHFTFQNIRGSSYLLEASSLGYESFRKIIEVNTPAVDLGALVMSESTIPLKEVIIEGRIPAVLQKGDTTEYTAKAFKVNKDATAEDLVTKMPGVTIESGTVKAQGENVQQILVDGRPFFGTDPMLALRNLPSDVIDKVQVFDKLSDQAQLTGFDDGQSSKTMNIVTRPERRQGQFGRFTGGYGTEDRYNTGGNLNIFKTDRRISIIGLSNNVNQQNFSQQDLLGVMGGGGNQRGGSSDGAAFGRGRRGGSGRGTGGGPIPGGGGTSNNFLVGQQTGITSANSLGLNYADSLGDKIYMNGSYFFNFTDNDNPQTLNRQYILSSDSSGFYNETSGTERKNYNHRVNLRFEGTFDSSNSFIITPQLYFQNNRATSTVAGSSLLSGNTLLGQSQIDNTTGANGNTLQNHIVFRHKFATPGRTISLDVGAGSNRKQSNGNLYSLDKYYNNQSTLNDTVNQQSDILTDGYSLSSSLVYTEPIGGNSLLQVNYNPTYSKNRSDNRTYNFNPVTNDYTDLTTTLSNTFENTYVTNSTGIGYRLRGQSFNSTLGVSYQIARLEGEQSFPLSEKTEKTFYTLLPIIMVNYQLSAHQNLRLFYRTSTASPAVTQLQNVVDNTNPLLLSAGNPGLKQSYSQTFLSRLSLANSEAAQSIMLFFYMTFTQDYIGNSTLIAQRDTLLPGNIRLNQGSQLTTPVNLSGNWSARSLFTYGLPVDFLKSNLNLNAGFNYTRTPGVINGIQNISNVYNLNPAFVLGSSISEDIDFTLSYSANFNIAKNTAQSASDNNYFSHTAGVKLNWIFWQGIVVKNEMTNTLYSGLTGGLNQNYLLWNVSFGKKLFEDQRGELLLTVFDLLNQNRNINRTVTETYIEDATTRVLQRYVILSFSYSLRQFRELKSDF